MIDTHGDKPEEYDSDISGASYVMSFDASRSTEVRAGGAVHCVEIWCIRLVPRLTERRRVRWTSTILSSGGDSNSQMAPSAANLCH